MNEIYEYADRLLLKYSSKKFRGLHFNEKIRLINAVLTCLSHYQSNIAVKERLVLINSVKAKLMEIYEL